MCHIGGLVSALAMLLAGATHVLLPKFKADLAIDLIGRHSVTAIITIPTIINDIYNLSKNEKFKSMKTVLNGAAALSCQEIVTK